MTPQAIAYFAAGIGAGLVVIGGAAGIGRLAAATMEGIARQPNAAGDRAVRGRRHDRRRDAVRPGDHDHPRDQDVGRDLVAPMGQLAGLVLAAGGLTDVNLALTIWTVVLFVLFSGVLAKFGWKPLLAMIEEREKSVRDNVEGAHKANAEAAALLEKHKQMLRDTLKERDEIVKRSQQEADQLKAQLVEKARAEGEQLVKRAKDQIEREKSLAIQELRKEVADIAVEAASRIVKSSLTPDAQRKLVGDYISNLPKVVQ
jgi:F-type H+-transporting ATPase subunit b